jgi:hypothetical protein
MKAARHLLCSMRSMPTVLTAGIAWTRVRSAANLTNDIALLSPTNSCRGAWPIVSRIRAGQHLRIGELAPGLVAQRERQLIAWQGQKVAQLAHQI